MRSHTAGTMKGDSEEATQKVMPDFNLESCLALARKAAAVAPVLWKHLSAHIRGPMRYMWLTLPFCLAVLLFTTSDLLRSSKPLPALAQ